MAKSEARAPKQAFRMQVAALPFRIDNNGAIEILLVSSRETRRWVIPKGWPMPGRKNYQAAAKEAREEAGVAGTIRKQPFGFFTYQKRLNDKVQPCRVLVYLLKVEKQFGTWPEKTERTRHWFTAEEAADEVSEPRLAFLILKLKEPRSVLELNIKS